MVCKIGITCDYETFTDKRGSSSGRYLIHQHYIEAITAFDALPLPLTYSQHVDGVLANIDGLVLSGGDFDHPPSYYQEQPHALLGNQLPLRSDFERALLEAALKQNKPVLGICGGMQLLNIVASGNLYQDLSLRAQTHVHVQPQPKAQAHHSITLQKNTLLYQLYGQEKMQVNSTHHQVIRTLGKNVIASAVAEDGVIEAIELSQYTFAVGVQWHPETLAKSQGEQALAVYRGLIHASRRVPV